MNWNYVKLPFIFIRELCSATWDVISTIGKLLWLALFKNVIRPTKAWIYGYPYKEYMQMIDEFVSYTKRDFADRYPTHFIEGKNYVMINPNNIYWLVDFMVENNDLFSPIFHEMGYTEWTVVSEANLQNVPVSTLLHDHRIVGIIKNNTSTWVKTMKLPMFMRYYNFVDRDDLGVYSLYHDEPSKFADVKKFVASNENSLVTYYEKKKNMDKIAAVACAQTVVDIFTRGFRKVKLI